MDGFSVLNDRSLATKEMPLLNRGRYVSESNRTKEDDTVLVYDTSSMLTQRTHISLETFERIYHDTLRNFTQNEKYQYRQYLKGEKDRSEFYRDCANYLKRNHPEEMSEEHDFNIMMNRINMAIFQFDVLQPLISLPDTTDIKICRFNDIRVRVKGKAYKSNASFMDEADMVRFVEGLAIRNQIDLLSNGLLTYTDNNDNEYILRFTISSPMITSTGSPYLHIRKIPRKKPFFEDLIEAGMLNEDIKTYLIDRAKLSKGIVFAGPPGSGKSTILNAFIEHIPKTRETLVIQENDELHTDQSGFMFKHVCHGFKANEKIITLEDLAKMALVEGCNEFIIGEVKGGEMRYAMTLANAGGHIGLTVHSTNAQETLDKLADLVKYGSDYSYEEARMMLKTMDTIVYLEGFKVREILECKGYDKENHVFLYDYIYKYDPEKNI